VSAAGDWGLFQGVKRSVIGAAALLFFDGVFTASFLWSSIVCPIWFLFSLVNSAIQRPGWGLALLRVGIPALTLALVLANNAIQNRIAETNARRVISACEAYHAANGVFPKDLKELVPQYLSSVPVAKYCLGPPRVFYYFNSGKPTLFWQIIPPYYRKFYDFEDQRWSYLD